MARMVVRDEDGTLFNIEKEVGNCRAAASATPAYSSEVAAMLSNILVAAALMTIIAKAMTKQM